MVLLSNAAAKGFGGGECCELRDDLCGQSFSVVVVVVLSLPAATDNPCCPSSKEHVSLVKWSVSEQASCLGLISGCPLVQTTGDPQNVLSF